MQPRATQRLFQDQANALQASGVQMPLEKANCEATMTRPLQPRAARCLFQDYVLSGDKT